LFKRFALILASIGFAFAACSAVATAGPPSDAAATNGAHKAPMHPRALTLRGHSSGAKSHRRHPNYVHDTFHQPTHIHGTMAGPRM
jgi:hypothetical protein